MCEHSYEVVEVDDVFAFTLIQIFSEKNYIDFCFCFLHKEVVIHFRRHDLKWFLSCTFWHLEGL